jgi:hypothetical protein
MEGNIVVFAFPPFDFLVMHQRVTGVVVFEADTAKRIAARYYDASLTSFEAQTRLEKEMISKAVKSSAVLSAAGIGSGPSGEKLKDGSSVRRQSSSDSIIQGSENAEVILVDSFLVILRLVNDVLVAVIAREDQNDLLMDELASTIVSSLMSITMNNLTKKKLFDRLDQVFVIIDECIEDGVIFELDPNNIYARVNMNEDGTATPPVQLGAAGRPITASMAVREGIAAISRGDADSLRSVFAGAAQTFSNFLGR